MFKVGSLLHYVMTFTSKSSKLFISSFFFEGGDIRSKFLRISPVTCEFYTHCRSNPPWPNLTIYATEYNLRSSVSTVVPIFLITFHFLASNILLGRMRWPWKIKFKIRLFRTVVHPLLTAQPWRWGRCGPSKPRYLLTQRNRVTS
jgi:hypothetical protein